MLSPVETPTMSSRSVALGPTVCCQVTVPAAQVPVVVATESTAIGFWVMSRKTSPPAACTPKAKPAAVVGPSVSPEMSSGPVVESTKRIDWLSWFAGVPVMFRKPARVTTPGTVSWVTVVPVLMFTVRDEPAARLKLAAERPAFPVKARVPPPLTPALPVTLPDCAMVSVPAPVWLMLPAVKGMSRVAFPVLTLMAWVTASVREF